MNFSQLGKIQELKGHMDTFRRNHPKFPMFLGAVAQNAVEEGTIIEINVCKKKQLTNTRSSSADEALRLTPPKILSLEQALDFIDTDELLEVTPTNLRIRKKILDPTMRKRAMINKKA